MPNMNIVNAEQDPAWMRVEELGFRLNQLRGALQVGSWAVMAHENCAGTIWEEINDFTQVLRYYCEGMEQECSQLCQTRLEELRARKEAV